MWYDYANKQKPNSSQNLNLIKGYDFMKKHIRMAILGFLAVLVILFFPISNKHSILGEWEVLTQQKEKTGSCMVEIEIKEVSSLLICYKKSFSFSIDGNSIKEYESTAFSETDEICLISQMYYDKEANSMRLASLIYPKDLSYTILDLGENYYFINNGANISYAELPIS